MKVLISPVDAGDTAIAALGGADLMDTENIAERSLGARFPWATREPTRAVNRACTTSSTSAADMGLDSTTQCSGARDQEGPSAGKIPR
ncbi:(5-formylfuran-3-yl)methyl phosphate synthase [Streptomyces uncialis]|uniref:(5-formylfuran-3-yl)methyl phosphate synthase n=1 Tax=Streptomyces uncialis TaxID=1048205 RepID=UPI0033FB86AF